MLWFGAKSSAEVPFVHDFRGRAARALCKRRRVRVTAGRGRLDLVEQLPRPHAERHRQFLHDSDGRVSRATLNVADIGAVDLGLEPEYLLRPALLVAKAS